MLEGERLKVPWSLILFNMFFFFTLASESSSPHISCLKHHRNKMASALPLLVLFFNLYSLTELMKFFIHIYNLLLKAFYVSAPLFPFSPLIKQWPFS